MMWFSGLRGPVCFALAFRISSKAVPESEVRNVLITTTLLIIWSTAFVMGGMSDWILHRLGFCGKQEKVEVKTPKTPSLPNDLLSLKFCTQKTLEESQHWFKKLNRKYLNGPFGADCRDYGLRHNVTIYPNPSFDTMFRSNKTIHSVIPGGPTPKMTFESLDLDNEMEIEDHSRATIASLKMPNTMAVHRVSHESLRACKIPINNPENL